MLRRLPPVQIGTERAAISSYYLSDAGIAVLREMLASGSYRIQVPEEGALLVVTWLLDHGHADQARALLDVLGPHLAQLRFYPIPAARPIAATSLVHRQTIGETVRDLQALRVSHEIATEREAIIVWAPLYDRVVALFAETVAGPLPMIRVDPTGRPLRIGDGRVDVAGGWPCQHYRDDWSARAQAVLSDYQRLRVAHTRCTKPERPSENFAILRSYLAQCIADPRQLTGRDVGMIRAILAAIHMKRGLPGSERCAALRHAQRTQVARPHLAELAPLLIDRLAQLPHDEGLAALDDVLASSTADAVARFGHTVNQPLPPKLVAMLQRCVDAPVAVLVAQGVIPSGEVLARVIPQITAQVRASGIAEVDARRLFTAMYAAFRQRRSLLLLNLEHQIRLEELPWVAAITAFRTDDVNSQAQAHQILEQVVTLAITAFPQQILPNKLLQEIRALATGAALRLPIVEELAADIFMGDFSETYLRAAQQASTVLAGSLYERYYGIAYPAIQQIDDVTPSRYGTPTSAAFTKLCYERAGVTPTVGRWSVAHNGMVIEQAQILTTHNLAVLGHALRLADTLGSQLDDLARHCFVWICRLQQQPIDAWQPRLRMMKNSAYAWRQMIFFLALLPAARVDMFLGWASTHLGQQRPAFQIRFRPALQGLALVASGGAFESHNQLGRADDARRFLGWTTERHWLMESP